MAEELKLNMQIYWEMPVQIIDAYVSVYVKFLLPKK